jgi:hypothetical protein
MGISQSKENDHPILHTAPLKRPASPTSVAAPARPTIVAARPEVALLIVLWPVVISWPVIIRAPRRGAVAWAAVVAVAVIGTLAVVVRLAIIALVEVVKSERERERDAPADLRLSWALGGKEQTACCEQNEKPFHALNVKPASEPRIPIFLADWCEELSALIRALASVLSFAASGRSRLVIDHRESLGAVAFIWETLHGDLESTWRRILRSGIS